MGEEKKNGMRSYLEQCIRHGICLAIEGQKSSGSHELCDSEGR
jgi:hypothetical protein